MRLLSHACACAGLVALGACSQAPAPPAAKLWTLFDVESLYAGGAGGSRAIAGNDGLPGGIPLDLVASGPTPGATLAPRTALADGEPVTFLTTEVWANYPDVWTQPAYQPATRASDGSLQPLGGALAPIFSVGPASGFYSPFWQLVYAEVPAGTAPGALTSARQILDGGYPLTPGPGRMMPLAPDGLGLPDGLPVAATPGTGWVDGARIAFFDFGGSTFTWDPASNVVQPATIYVLTFVDAGGVVRSTPAILTVLGAAPQGAGIPQPCGGQRNSSYWRVVTVPVPAGARVFAPPQATDLLSALAAEKIDPGTYTAAVTGASDQTVAAFAPFYGRVALNPGDPAQGVSGCFDDPALLAHDEANPASCAWIDSEAAVEANLDLSRAEPTALTLTWEVTDCGQVGGTEVPVPLQVTP
ncbi:MAG TPA: hypothetical protein VHO06_00710 [Polyangia bacterium]|nr:hypothetical protein [Polyangia bacterium]